METTIVYWAMGIMEKKMETTIVYRDIGIMEDRMETPRSDRNVPVFGGPRVSCYFGVCRGTLCESECGVSAGKSALVHF